MRPLGGPTAAGPVTRGLAGVLIGPHTLGFVADVALAGPLADERLQQVLKPLPA
jgi:predicted Kef-type K+ transport protein